MNIAGADEFRRIARLRSAPDPTLVPMHPPVASARDGSAVRLRSAPGH